MKLPQEQIEAWRKILQLNPALGSSAFTLSDEEIIKHAEKIVGKLKQPLEDDEIEERDGKCEYSKMIDNGWGHKHLGRIAL